MFEPGEMDSFVVVLRTDPLTNTADTGLWNTCIRLAEQHFNKKLYVNLRNAFVVVQVLEFVLTVRFELQDVPAMSANRNQTCLEFLGLGNSTFSPTK